MKCLLCVVMLCLVAPAAWAQRPEPGSLTGPGPTGESLRAQDVQPRAIAVGQIDSTTLAWDWSQGAPPNNAIPEKFIVRCIRAGEGSAIEKRVDYPAKRIRMNALLPGPGTYSCTVTAWDAETTEEGPASAPLPFVVTGGAAAAPSNLRLD